MHCAHSASKAAQLPTYAAGSAHQYCPIHARNGFISCCNILDAQSNMRITATVSNGLDATRLHMHSCGKHKLRLYIGCACVKLHPARAHTHDAVMTGALGAQKSSSCFQTVLCACVHKSQQRVLTRKCSVIPST